MAVFFANLMFAFVRKAPAPANPWGQGRDHAQMDFAVAAAVPSVRYPAAGRRPESRQLK
jgi:hypothetical protein